MLKSVVRRVIETVASRERFNDSRVYRAYVRLRYPDHAKREAMEIDFYGKLLSGSVVPLIFDIGANVGSKTKVFLQHATRVVSVEANPETFLLLQDRFRGRNEVVLVEAACGARAGTAQMYAFKDGGACDTLSAKWVGELTGEGAGDCKVKKQINSSFEVPVTTLDLLIATHGKPDYVKIDVEGYEFEVLKGLTVPVPLVSVECNLPAFEKETLDIIDLLAARAPGVRFNYATTEPPLEFASHLWLDKGGMVAVIASRKHSYLELYCRSHP